jgi:hypothetical protein
MDIDERRREVRSRIQRKSKEKTNIYLGVALLIVIFAFILFSAMSGGSPAAGNTSEAKDTSIPTAELTLTPTLNKETSVEVVSIPPPSIRINSPENKTYNTSLPTLDFIVAGSKIDTVLLSVDGGANITIPHDGTLAEIDFSKGNPIFIEDFSGGVERWGNNRNWKADNGKYVLKSGTSSFGSLSWKDYILEIKTKIVSGKDISVDFRWDGGKRHYRLQTNDAYGNLNLYKMDERGYTSLFSSKLPNLKTNDWHTWKIVANGSNIQAYIDNVQYIDYTDGYNPYLKGGARLRLADTSAEYDYVQAYKPFTNGPHNLTIFANNSAGYSNSKTIYFTTNESKDEISVVEKVNFCGMKGTITNGDLSVTLEGYAPSYKVISYSGSDEIELYYSRVNISIKNVGDEKTYLSFSPNEPILIDNKGGIYDYYKLKIKREDGVIIDHPDQLKLGVSYPNTKKKGCIFFYPTIDTDVEELDFILFLNGEKYEFKWDRSRLG